MLTQINRITIGKQIEELAIIYLTNKNLAFIEKNFRSKYGEIDLIFKDLSQPQQQIIFVEVRYRKSIFFGEPKESITRSKQKKIITTANYYLNYKFCNQPIYYRFDVIACSGSLNNIKIDWIKDAFC
jgi:putative endonuclease